MGFTPLAPLTFAAIIMIFTGDQKWYEKFLIILGGTPYWGFYLILVSSAIDQLTHKNNPVACLTWLACLHWVYISAILDKIKGK